MIYYQLIVSLIGIAGLIIFREDYIIFAVICFLAIIFDDGLNKIKSKGEGKK